MANEVYGAQYCKTRFIFGEPLGSSALREPPRLSVCLSVSNGLVKEVIQYSCIAHRSPCARGELGGLTRALAYVCGAAAAVAVADDVILCTLFCFVSTTFGFASPARRSFFFGLSGL